MNYDDLIKNTDENICKALEFFSYKNINLEIVKKVNQYNSVDFIKDFTATLKCQDLVILSIRTKSKIKLKIILIVI